METAPNRAIEPPIIAPVALRRPYAPAPSEVATLEFVSGLPDQHLPPPMQQREERAKRSSRAAKPRGSWSSAWRKWGNLARRPLRRLHRDHRPVINRSRRSHLLLARFRCGEKSDYATTLEPRGRCITPGSSTYGGGSRARFHYPEGPQRPPALMHCQRSRLSGRRIKVTGVIFSGLRSLAVDPVRDPPGGHCFNC